MTHPEEKAQGEDSDGVRHPMDSAPRDIRGLEDSRRATTSNTFEVALRALYPRLDAKSPQPPHPEGKLQCHSTVGT